MVVKTHTLSYPVVITTAQFSSLLTIVHAEQLFGADNGRLFPAGDDARTALWQTGQQQLERDGWFIKEGESYNANEQLLLLIATR